MANILVIEDDKVMLNAISIILRKNNHNVDIAVNGKEAYEKLAGKKYDLVITDIMMPYANGVEIISRIKTDPKIRDTNVIVISSVGDEETISECYRVGAEEFYKKPIVTKELIEKITKIMSKPIGTLVTKKKKI